MYNEKTFYDLSVIAYFNTSQVGISVSDLIKQILSDKQLEEDYKEEYDFLKNRELISKIDTSIYDKMLVRDYFNDNKKTGIVYYIFETEDALFFSFRGSEHLDDLHHKTGWQDWMDNFRMFLKNPTYQQIYALQLLQESVIEKPFYLCGHSKGGNLALFLALTMKDALEDKLLCVYSFNAPGITRMVLSMYDKRAKDETFLKKIKIFENENDPISAFFENLTTPFYIRSSIPCTNLTQLYQNHNISAMNFEENLYVLAEKKTAMPNVVYHFVNDFFVNLKEERLEAVVKLMDDYFDSGLSMNELYKVMIYHISKYTSLFEDISYEEIQTITFQDLIEKRKTKNLVAKVKEIQPKETIKKLADSVVTNSLAKLNEIDIKEITQGIIDNYELLLKEKKMELQQVLIENNEKIIKTIKAIRSREPEK